MVSRVCRLLLVLVAAFACLPAFAQERATPEEAKALVQKAAELYRTQGRDKALARFADPDGGFMPKDLFIFVQDLKGVMILHPKNPSFNGKDLSGLKDPDGKLLVAEMAQMARENGSGWVSYKFVNPATKRIEQKTTYVERVGNVLVAGGSYRP